MDREFFEQLAMPLFNQVYNHAHWLAGNRADAEDLVQETYAKALKGFGSFSAGTNFRAWIFRILRNTFLTSRSGLASRRTGYLEDEEGNADEAVVHEVTPEQAYLRRESANAVVSALERIPAHFREIILLCEVEEMSYREIAEVLDIPVGTVMSRLSRARSSLRNALGGGLREEVG
jgi:RNA polymerase sigma-70 factor (ECF subfamily)